MSVLEASLVNATVMEAVRLALDRHAAEGHVTTGDGNSAGLSAEQEQVVRAAVLAGLQDLSSAGEPASSRTVRAALTQLMRNASATQSVVQQALASIRTHLCAPKTTEGAGGHRAAPDDVAAAAAVVYAATPDVTRALEHAVAAAAAAATTAPPTPAEVRDGSIAAHLGSLSGAEWMWLSASLLLGWLVVRFVFGRLLGFSGAGLSRRPRTSTVLIGLPDSGKTALFAQLVRHQQLRESRTSMRANAGFLCAVAQHGRAESAAGVRVVDCPGHPRLREEMLRAVAEAVNVVVVIDAVTVQDNQQEGVAALAELLLSVLQSPEFYGVRRLLFACTKRDEVISYASKAVRKLLEAAMVASIESRLNTMGRVESVRDSKNTVITGRGKSGGGGAGGGRRYMLSVDGGAAGAADAGGEAAVVQQARLRGAAAAAAVGGSKGFSFEQLGIPVAFVDVSSRPNAAEHRYTVTPVEEFVLGSAA